MNMTAHQIYFSSEINFSLSFYTIQWILQLQWILITSTLNVFTECFYIENNLEDSHWKSTCVLTSMVYREVTRRVSVVSEIKKKNSLYTVLVFLKKTDKVFIRYFLRK